MESRSPSEIHAAIELCEKDLGYYKQKLEQHRALAAFFKWQGVFALLPMGFEITLCFSALPGTFDQLKGKMKASVVVMY